MQLHNLMKRIRFFVFINLLSCCCYTLSFFFSLFVSHSLLSLPVQRHQLYEEQEVKTEETKTKLKSKNFIDLVLECAFYCVAFLYFYLLKMLQCTTLCSYIHLTRMACRVLFVCRLVWQFSVSRLCFVRTMHFCIVFCMSDHHLFNFKI